MSAPKLSYISFEEFRADIEALANAIKGASWVPDYIIGIGRGGLMPGLFLSHALGLPLLTIDYSTSIPDFSDELLAKLALRSASGENLLFVDDINDSGRTIGRLRAALAANSLPGNIRFAVLIDNVVSTEQVDYRTRSIDRTIVKDWFVFPWEAVAATDSIVEDAQEVPERTR